VTSELKEITGQEYVYFGESHLQVETGHTMNESDIEKYFADIQLTELQYEQAVNTVEKIFDIFSAWTYELLNYAHNHSRDVLQEEFESYQSQFAICW
jgi:hypothetical protein